MTLKQAFDQGKKQALSREAGVELPAFDVMCLFTFCFGLDRQGLILHGEQAASDEEARRFLNLVRRRAAGEPLQYLLGSWEFMGLALSVGPGVLIPREDTEPLVREAARRLAGVKKPLVLDLCGGSGAVALGLASLLPEARVVSLELSEEAYPYLCENIKRHFPERVKAMRLDVLKGELPFEPGSADAIVSNPPYICTEELPSLQLEVRKEPQMALDGGDDGLIFYRAIAKRWLPVLKPGGVIAVEVGENQAAEVQSLFASQVSQVTFCKDPGGIDRVVAANKNICLPI